MAIKYFGYRGFFFVFMVMMMVSAGSARAWFGRRSPQADGGGADAAAKPAGSEPEQVIADLSPQKGEEFLQVLTFRQRRRGEILVLNNILEDKKRELTQYAEVLERDFSIQPDQDYRFDVTNRLIYAVSTNQPAATATAVDAPAAGTGRHVHVKQLSSDEDVQRFLILANARVIARNQVAVLHTLIREKAIELQRVNNLLETNFNIDPEKNYRYDQEKRRIIQVE